jgi:hypothetical protein
MNNKKDAYYFPHDSNARHDPKIVKMLTQYPNGYQWYFMIIEILREQSDYKYRKDAFCWDAISSELHIKPDEVKQFLADCVKKFHLFRQTKSYFWSESLVKRMAGKDQKSEIYRLNAQIRWDKEKEKKMQLHEPLASDLQSNGNAIAMHSEKNTLEENTLEENKSPFFLFAIPPELKDKPGFIEAWKQWKYLNDERETPLIPIVVKAQFNFLLEQPDPVEILTLATRSNWRGIFPTNKNNNKPGQSTELILRSE